MKYANKLGFSWGMVTNGTLITPAIVRQMKEAKMSTISVSLDGLEKSHNWLRRTTDGFRRTIKALSFLLILRILVEVITCVNQRNIKELEEIYELINFVGVNHWRIFTISPVGRAKNKSELFLTSQNLIIC